MTEPEGSAPTHSRGPLLYDESYYQDYEGGSYQRGGHWTRFFGAISDEVVARWNPRTTLDAGCALGIFVAELRARGVQAWGVDVSEFAIASAAEDVRPHLRQGSLAESLPADLPARYDLASCIEVLEHMERADADRAIATLCSVTDRILFSSTPDGYAEPTHFACRPPEEWSAVFARHGFFRDLGADVSFVAPWAVMYVRQNWTTFQAVLEYDRVYSRLREENRQLRSAVIGLDKKASKTDAEEFRGQIRELSAEIGRLRCEAAATAGRVTAEVEARMRDTLTWRLGSTVVRPVARMRRRTPEGDGQGAGGEGGFGGPEEREDGS
ncbi:MAG TPA: class I SAM-dependent methyltransferase [Mycobacteriales bacterium]|nr:class I SAM-dependent methyltransferase [Mycobacteriales bacterium]